MGLSSAAALDVMIMVGLCYYLRKRKSRMSTYVPISLTFFLYLFNDIYRIRMNEIIDTLVLYTVETGAITW